MEMGCYRRQLCGCGTCGRAGRTCRTPLVALRVEIQDSADAVGERLAVDSCLRSQLARLRSAAIAGTTC